MKRTVVIMLTVLLCAVLTACGTNSSDVAVQNKGTAKADQTQTQNDEPKDSVDTKYTEDTDSEPQVLPTPDPLVKELCGEYVEILDAEKGLAKMGLDIGTICDAVGFDIAERMADSVLPVYLIISEDGSCKLKLWGEDMTKLVCDMYETAYGKTPETVNQFEDDISSVLPEIKDGVLYINGEAFSNDNGILTGSIDGITMSFEPMPELEQ